MGDDCLILHMPWCFINEARTARLLEIVAGLSDEDVDELANVRGMWDEDAGEQLEVRLECRKALQRLVDVLERIHQSREVTVIRPEGALYDSLATGGMSWGDVPTEVYDYFELVNECEPIWNQLRLWALEDANPDRWQDSLTQFARLIAEIEACGGFDIETIDALCESMDLEKPLIHALIDRAQAHWDEAKSRV